MNDILGIAYLFSFIKRGLEGIEGGLGGIIFV
jgi:hypothetical protein